MIGVLLLTAVAGGVGGAVRFLVDTAVGRGAALRAAHRGRTGGRVGPSASVPLGTIVVNVSACLLLGVVTGATSAHVGADDLRTIVGVGLLGGYSTFSAASVEGLALLAGGRPVAAVVHAGGMLVLSVVASVLGLALGALL